MALQFEPEVGHARWFVDGDSDWQRLCSIGPSGFARYVRVLHPVDDRGVGDEHPDGIALANLLRVLERQRALRRTASSACGTATGTCMAGPQLLCCTRRGARAGGIGGGRARS